MNLSKSKYTTTWQCPKALWMKKYKPEELLIDENVRARMAAGNEVGDLAMSLFGDYVDVTEYKDDKIDLNRMIEKTNEEMKKGTQNICEASFLYNGLYCAVDILRKEEDGYSIYEVKSSTHDDKDVYFADIAYQKYVLEHCGINVINTYLVVINNEYVYDGALKVGELFKITDVKEGVEDQYLNVEMNLKTAEKILQSDTEPDIDLDLHCNRPYRCGFWKYCSRNLPEPSVFNLYRIKFKDAISFYKEGIISYEQLEADPRIKNLTQLKQIDFELHDKGAYIDKAIISEFLDKCSYPLYFLDFETEQPVIPKYVGTKPYQQIPFQYSLHYIEKEGGELKHKEFLGISGQDPRRALAEQLCKDIPYDACTMAYNKMFECGRIKELAESFPDLADHLLNIERNIIDLLDPFRQGGYYCKAMGGSFSIKSVLPAMFSNDPELDYHNLEGVHNGGEAMSIYPKIQYMDKDEQKIARHNLLKYCELDTYAMVKVWMKLKGEI
jgi:hypothetical protein